MASPPPVQASVNYSLRNTARPRYHANDTSGDQLFLDEQIIDIYDRRHSDIAPSWRNEGFELVRHHTNVRDWSDQDRLKIYDQEIKDLLLAVSGADAVLITAPPVLRFSEKSVQSGALDNSRPARFVHVDVSEKTAHEFAIKNCPKGKSFARFVQFNVWRVLSNPPQDVPLTLCDGRSLTDDDMIAADAIFDRNGEEIFRFEGLVIGSNVAHNWSYFSEMNSDEAIIFVTHNSDPNFEGKHGATYVPHSAFNHPDVPDNTPPRESVEIRAIAYWYA